jgi:16S rRNA (guanine(1405)-N(7))-methyltransferase
MQLPADVQFYGYDIHQERVALLNRFMQLAGRQPLVKMQDIAQVFPRESADVALFLKELPRFEKNYGNLGLPLLQSLSVRWIVLSFPAVSLHGGRSLRKHYSAYCERLLAPVGWSFVQLEMANELLFCIQKT